MRDAILLAAVLALAGSSAGAADRPYSFAVGGGASFPASDSRERFDAGWNFSAAVTWHAGERFGLRLDYLYADHDVKRELSDVRLDANHSLQHVATSLVLGTPRSRGPRVYLLGGPALYFRAVEITRFSGISIRSFCDPWLFVCVTDVVPIETAVGSRDSTDWGLQGGAGVSFPLSDGARLFLEARYQHVFGDDFGGRRATGKYLPVSLGVEF